jgi:hypothetical protein
LFVCLFIQSKEPEYTKVRRTGSRLRDESHDVQFLESDNPGSTDSEVRKILSLHIPITEYDTLGSESDNECSAKSVKQAKFKTQRGNAKFHCLVKYLMSFPFE